MYQMVSLLQCADGAVASKVLRKRRVKDLVAQVEALYSPWKDCSSELSVKPAGGSGSASAASAAGGAVASGGSGGGGGGGGAAATSALEVEGGDRSNGGGGEPSPRRE